jgi:hypothetical protein
LKHLNAKLIKLDFEKRIDLLDSERKIKLATIKKILIKQKIFENTDEELIIKLIRYLQNKIK